MVKDVVDSEAAIEPVKSAGALLKRAEQLKRWEESEMNKNEILPHSFNNRRTKVQFPKGCIFLAACASGDLDEVKSLLAAGSDINTANVDGLTALHQAVIDQNLEMVQYLIANGADIDAQDNEGWTPLMAGVSCNFVEIVRYLLSKQADPVLQNNDGELPVDLAETDDMRQILEKEIRLKGINIEDARLREEQLMSKDAIEWSNSTKITKEQRHPVTGATAVHVAAAKGYIKVLKILLQAGADVNAKDNDGWTPLHAAAHWGERESCELLVEHNAHMDELNNLGLSCFDVADPDMVPFLENLKEKQKLMSSAQKRFGPPVIIPSEPPPQLPSWRLTGRRLAQPPANNGGGAVTSVLAALQSSQQPMGGGPAAPAATPLVPSTTKIASVTTTVTTTVAMTTTTTSTAPLPCHNDPPKTVVVFRSSPNSSSADEVRWRKRPDEQQSTANSDDKKNVSLTQRGEESESERKLRAKRERESRRSTQGITLETVKAAEQLFSDRRKATDNNKEPNPPPPAFTNTTKKYSSSSKSNNVQAQPQGQGHHEAAGDSASLENSENEKPTAANRRRTRNSRRSTGPIAQDDVQLALENDKDSIHTSAPDQNNAKNQPAPPQQTTTLTNCSNLETNNKEQLQKYHHQPHFSTHGWRFLTTEEKNRDKLQLSKPSAEIPNLSDYRNNRSQFIGGNSEGLNERFSRTSSGVSVGSTAGHDVEIDYKKLYEKEIIENERLRKIISDMEKSLENMKFNAKQASGDGTHIVPYNSRLEKLAADLDDEKRTKDQILQDNARLKEENGALIRVISKLSKTK